MHGIVAPTLAPPGAEHYSQVSRIVRRVKTICTTNCTWSATQRMVGALVEHLGEPSAGGYGHAFPTADAMARTPEAFYRDVARAGYRGPYLRALAASVADGSLDLEALAVASPEELPDDELEKLLLALPGVGPYAAAHIMMLIGRHSRLILDSWTRPKYASLNGGRKASDRTIAPIPPLRPLRRPRLLALPHPGLGGGVVTLTQD